MSAGKVDLKIEQGATYQHPFAWKDNNGTPIDITGWTARMHIRSSVSDDVVLMELTTGNGRITLDGPEGKVTLTISATDTTAISWKKGVYDLELEDPGGYVKRLVEGKVSVSMETTR